MNGERAGLPGTTLGPVEREAWARSYENWDWLKDHPEVLESHRGQYVAVYDCRVVVSGADPQTFRAALEASPYRSETVLMLRVPRSDEVAGLLVL